MEANLFEIFMFRIHSSSSRKFAHQLNKPWASKYWTNNHEYTLIIELAGTSQPYCRSRSVVEMTTKKINRRKKRAAPPLLMPQGQDSMKRTADSIENDPLVTAATAATETTQYKTAKRKDVGAQEHSSNLTTDETCLDKLRKSLFNRPCVVFPPRPPAPFKIGYDGTIRPSSPQVITRYEGVASLARLSNNAITAMLGELHQDYPFTQSVVHGEEAITAGKRRLMTDRGNIQKRIAPRLCDRARHVANLGNVSEQEINPFPAQLPREDETQDDCKDDALVSMREQLVRVSQAHERLQKMIESFQNR
ncbi:hypothetical protein N8T08_008199 [Aspergillus melleus]|uniref:Uncharacterized protein n=1 Tax=Aspergillus melleus TaxID=138277 RepID=A0ACC3AW53_9EURO|nr:hypothetical protein N8T08_008199 [Aspergillus melleus]